MSFTRYLIVNVYIRFLEVTGQKPGYETLKTNAGDLHESFAHDFVPIGR